MTYKDFKRELYENILQRKEAGGKQIKLLEKRCVCNDAEAMRLVQACNSVLYGRPEVYVREDMLCIAWEELKTLRMLYWYTYRLYEQFLKEGWQGVLPGIIAKLQNCARRMDAGMPQSLEDTFGRQIIRPLSYKGNREELKNSVYWRFGDIALVLYDFLYESGDDFMSMKSSREAVSRGGLPEEVVLVNALFQTRAILPPRLYHSGDITRYYSTQAGVFMPDDFGERIEIHNKDREEGMQGYRLTNTRRRGGALALFYPGVQERLCNLLGGDYYVGFISVHEAVIHPVRCKALNEMKAAIRRYHAMLDRDEVLTDSVYRYDRNRKRLFEV